MAIYWERIRRGLIAVLGIYSFFILAAGWGARRFLWDLPPIQRLGNYIPSLTTKIYDIRNELVTELFLEKRSVLPLNEIPVDMQHAVIATEDADFYTHWGIDLQSILRANLANLRAGRFVQGGSTISQQLAKNIFLTQERSLSRKLKELLLTLQIESTLSKDEILQLYINQIYFGTGAYGLESAALTFFAKNAKELTLPECALLAGLPKGPDKYSPYKHPDRAVQRRNYILERMVKTGYITEDQKDKAELAAHAFLRKSTETVDAAYFVEMIRIQLEPAYTREALLTGGYSIYTTLDMRMQRAADGAMERQLAAFDEKNAEVRLKYQVKAGKVTQDFYDRWKKWKAHPDKVEEPEDSPEPLPVQGALIAIDPHTGGIRALIGGRSFRESQFNRATQAKRQPGSTFKPFVWLAALDNGLTAASVVDDLPIAFANVETQPRLVAEATDYDQLMRMVTDYYKPNQDPEAPPPIWAPKNWDGKFFGPITLRRGLAFSRNLVSVRLINRVGPNAVVNEARAAGIESPLQPVLALGLGSSVVTVQEMASAIGTFANEGVHMKPFSVVKVVDRYNQVMQETLPQGTPGLSPQSTYLITRLMQAVVQEGTASYARNLGRPVAGKTGTTQDQRDFWFVGFTPDLVAAVWMGYDDFLPMGKKLSSAATTVPLWTDFMSHAVRYIPNRDFAVPPGIAFAKIDRDTGYLALPTCPRTVLEAFREGFAPKEFCPVDHESLEPEPEAVTTE